MMCLDIVSDNKHLPDAIGTGWKVFVLNGGRLVSWMGRWDDPYEINRWYEAYAFASSDILRYYRGFHIFTTLRDAKNWDRAVSAKCAICKIRWRHRLARGTQDFHNQNYSCIVAKEILILPGYKTSGDADD